jgi:hypothetical protein
MSLNCAQISLLALSQGTPQAKSRGRGGTVACWWVAAGGAPPNLQAPGASGVPHTPPRPSPLHPSHPSYTSPPPCSWLLAPRRARALCAPPLPPAGAQRAQWKGNDKCAALEGRSHHEWRCERGLAAPEPRQIHSPTFDSAAIPQGRGRARWPRPVAARWRRSRPPRRQVRLVAGLWGARPGATTQDRGLRGVARPPKSRSTASMAASGAD